MKTIKYEEKYIVIKKENLDLLTPIGKKTFLDRIEHLNKEMERKGKSTKNKYLVVNQDEPCADEILEIILRGEKNKLDNAKKID